MGSDADKLVYKLTNIQLEYETFRSKLLADEATSVYSNGKTFAYDHVMREKVITFAKGTEASLTFVLTLSADHSRPFSCSLLSLTQQAPET